MTDTALIIDVMQTLQRSSDLDSGGRWVLTRCTELLRDVLSGSTALRSSTVLRAMVHLRGESSYSALVPLEAGPGADETQLHSSTTLWRWVQRERAGVVCDVHTGQLSSLHTPDLGKGHIGGQLTLGETRETLTKRQTTHVLALPLLAGAGAVLGMLSFELRAEFRRELSEHWLDCLRALAPIADAAGPLLASLPASPRPPARTDELLPVVGERMQELVALLRVFAASDETLLLGGATGTGKSRLAAWCHARSPRARGPFVTLNLLAAPGETQLGELFGWRKGAFTGAQRDYLGAVGEAHGGTLFIDEIDKLSLGAQAGLLELLETRRYKRLGDSSSAVPADIRFIVGTNADLHEAVAAGTFREDLYYRIQVLPVALPCLDERRDEIRAWATYMLARRCTEVAGAREVRFDESGLVWLMQQTWPGNLRQLDNTVRRAAAVALATSADGLETATIDASVLVRATSLEKGPRIASGPDDLRRQLERVADYLVDEAQRLQARGETLDLSVVGLLRALTLKQAHERLGDIKRTYELFGLDRLIASRNHTKDYRQELAKLRAFFDE